MRVCLKNLLNPDNSGEKVELAKLHDEGRGISSAVVGISSVEVSISSAITLL